VSVIATKSEYFRLAAEGKCGNTMPSWPTPRAARASGYHGTVMVRYRSPDSPFMRADVEMDDVPAAYAEFVARGADPRKLYITHMTAQVGRRLNGELWRGPGGLYLHHSTAQTHLRAALEQSGRHAENSAALSILRWACCPNSLDDLMTLLDLYQDAVIEFTAYDAEIGDVPHRDCIVWEVRNY
jgi:hypothetical protein